MLTGKIDTSIWFCCIKKKIKGKMRYRGPTLIGTPKGTSHW